MEPLDAIIEALLFVAGEPVEVGELARAIGCTPLEIQAALAKLESAYADGPRGIMLQRVNDSVFLCTNRAYSAYVERLYQPIQQRSFSQAMMETLSVIAYKQPVTRAEIEAVRGVRCEYAVSQLVRMGMIAEVGRKDTVGRPALFGTTNAFLQHFALTSLDELPDRRLFDIERIDDEGSDSIDSI